MELARKLSLATVGAVIGLAGVVTSSIAPASAFSITTTPGEFSTVPGTTTVNFDSGSAPTTGYATYSGAGGSTPTVLSGSVASDHTAPSGDTTPYLTVAPAGSGAQGADSPVTITLSSLANYFGAYWGSIDAYNTISFYNTNTNTLEGSFTGASVPGVTDNGSQSAYVNFFAGAGQNFNEVVLGTTGIAFESDNHAFGQAQQVPEPLTIGGSALALGFGWMMKRKKALAS